MLKYNKISRFLSHKKFVVFLISFVLILTSTMVNNEAYGLFGKKSKNKVKVLGKTQHKKIVRKLVSNLVQDSFFKDADLCRKLVLADIKLEGNDLGIESEDFTNMILNGLLGYSQVMIMNQDLKVDLSLKYKLMHYLPATETRKKGILLGANYYVMGHLKSTPVVHEDGKVDRSYSSALQVRNIRTNKLIVKAVYDYKKKKKSKKEPKYR